MTLAAEDSEETAAIRAAVPALRGKAVTAARRAGLLP